MQRNVGFGEQADKRHALRQEAMAEHPKHFGASRRRRLPQPLFQYGKIVQLGRFAVEQVEQAVGAERGWIHGRRGGEDDSGDGDRVEVDSDNAATVMAWRWRIRDDGDASGGISRTMDNRRNHETST